MFVLDTNHLSELGYDSAVSRRLRRRMDAASADILTTIVCVEEGSRGWLGKIASAITPAQQVWAYAEYEKFLRLAAELIRLPWDAEAAARFADLRRTGVRIGTMDLRIACITIEHDATLLTRNTVDFAKEPGLRFENWLD